MAEEVTGVIESGEVGGNLKEGVTEADVQRIQENSHQMKKIAQQLQQDKKQNNQLANFLTFLLSEITNDKIIKGLYDTFFITIDPKTNIPYFRKNMNNVVVIGLFYPFYTEKAEELGVSHFYEQLNKSGDKSISGYMTYLQDLSDNYHDNIPISQKNFINLLTEIIKDYLPSSNPLGNEDYIKMIQDKLYGE